MKRMGKTIKELLANAIEARGRVAASVRVKTELSIIEGEEAALDGEGVVQVTQESPENVTIRQT